LGKNVRRKYTQFSIFGLFVLVIILVPSLIRPKVATEDEMAKLIRDLQESKPEYIFIGNSMLDSRLDKKKFEELSGSSCQIVWHGGVMSAVWYLIVKNVIATSKIYPKSIFIFFRDTYLTEPDYRVSGTYRRYLNIYSTGKEKILEDKLLTKNILHNRYEIAITKLYPLMQLKTKSRGKISGAAALMTKLIPLRFTQHFKISDVNNLFDFKNSRIVAVDGENIEENEWNYNFNEALNSSFLPIIVELSKSEKLTLVFIRVKKRPIHGSLAIQKPELNKYINDLKIYLASNDIGFYDFTGHPEITLDLYASGDHLNEEGKKKFTEIFVNTLILSK